MKISGKHSVEEINGTRCSVVEIETSEARANFLQALLKHNGYTVEIQKNIPPPLKPKKQGEVELTTVTETPATFKIGVTDITFNVSIMVFSRKLKTLENKILLPTYWTQEDMEYEGWYWKYK